MTRYCIGRALLFTGVAVCAVVAVSGLLQAQSVDHGALEALYGEPVTTSVTGRPQKASDAPADLVIVTADDIRRSGANTIPDVLQFVSGLDIRRYSALDFDVAVRGYNQPYNPRLLVLVNGRQVYLDDYGDVVWELIPVQLDEIRQIEVVKGPNAALFGFNAASGVINIVTYDPLFDKVNAATLRFGNLGLLQGAAVGTAHFGEDAGLRMSVGGVRQDRYNPAGLGAATSFLSRDPVVGAFNIDSKARPAPGVEVTLGGSMTNSEISTEVPSGTIYFSTYHTNSIKAGVMADTAWGTFALDAYRNALNIVLLAGPGFATSLQNYVYVVKASDTLQLNAANVVRGSLEYRNNSLYAGITGGTIGYQVYSAAGMWDWRINPRWTFTNSIRIDYLTLNYTGNLVPNTGETAAAYNNATFAQPSFNSGLLFRVTDLDTVRLTAARGLQVPSLVDYGLQYQPGPTLSTYLGSPTVAPTAVWNLELGYDRAIPTIDSTLRTAVFVQRNNNLITSGLDASPTLLPNGTTVLQTENIGYSDAIGSEIGIKGQSASGFRWNASYAFMAIRDHTTINRGALTSLQDSQTGTPTSVLIAGGGYTRDKLEIDAQARWQSRYQDFRSTPGGLVPLEIGNYLTLNGRIGYNLTENLIVALAGQQLNVSHLLQTAGPPVQRSVIGSVTLTF